MASEKTSTSDESDPHLLVLHLSQFLKADEPPFVRHYEILSGKFTGDIFAVISRNVWRNIRISRFEFLGLFLPQRIRNMNVIRNLLFATYAVGTALRRHYGKRRYDIVIATNPFTCAIVGLAVCALTGAKLVIEVNGKFDSAFRVDKYRKGFSARWRHHAAQFIIPLMLGRADAIKLLYEGQIDGVAGRRQLPCYIFPAFVSISLLQPTAGSGKYLLFLGYPWYLKGVDILIRSFQQISGEFPDYTLKVVGHCPDRTPFERLAAGNPRIEFAPGVWFKEVIQLMQNCEILVLPSRTETMGRVLIEAMACRKPVIAARVDGVPFVVEHGETGLLFESENVDDLAAQMRRLLTNSRDMDRIAQNGYRHALADFAEERYAVNYRGLADRVLGRVA